MREHKAEFNGVPLTYYVPRLVDVMRAAVAAAKRATDEAEDARFYKDEVDLEYELTQKLRDIERLDQDIKELNDERLLRTAAARSDFEKHEGTYVAALDRYVTVDDVQSARADYETARSEAESAEQRENALFEEYSRAQEESLQASARSNKLKSHWETAKKNYQAKPSCSDGAGAADQHQKARLEYNKSYSRFEMVKASIEKDYAEKILELRKAQAVAATAASALADGSKAFPELAPAPPADAPKTPGDAPKTPALQLVGGTK